MRIASIYTQKLQTDPKIQHAIDEPYGLEMIMAVARREGHRAKLFFHTGDTDEFVEEVNKFSPDIAAFSLYTCQYPAGKRIASKLKEANPNIITVAGNRYPTFLKYAEEPFDIFVLKEGEVTFSELLNTIDNSQSINNVKGISFRRDGKSIFTGLCERNFNLDALPIAMRSSDIFNQAYKCISIPPLSENPHYAIMEYSRCCYNACKFCDNPEFWGNKIVFRSPDNVLDEMFLLKDVGIDIFYFIDLNFTAVPEKTTELCEKIKKRKLKTSWYCMSNIATTDNNDYVLDAMKDAGCYKIAWGVESTSDNALKKMNKMVGENLTTNDQTIRVLDKSLKKGLLNQGYYIIGFPWETEESILKDAEKLRYMPLHQLNIGIFTPIPLSRFHREMVEQGYSFEPNLEKHDRNTLIYNHKTLTNEKIKELQQKIYDDFYSSPEYKNRLETSCRINPKLKKSFNDYFEFIGKRVEI